jgi:hypothetical protein
MNFFSRFLTPKAPQARVDTRVKTLELLRIEIKINREMFVLSDYSEKGFACTRVNPGDEEISFEIGEMLEAEFLIFGYQKSATRIEVRWKKGQSFGARVVNLGPFQDFANRFLKSAQIE